MKIRTIGIFLLYVASTSCFDLKNLRSCLGTLCVKSTDFKFCRKIPAQFTCQGANISPELHWRNVSKQAKSIVIIVDDPDAPAPFPTPFVHWVVYDLPVTTVIPGNVNIPFAYPTAKVGINDFGIIGYSGPCPPRGDGTHRYRFKVYAVNISTLGLASGSTKTQVTNAIKGHILQHGTLIGTYKIS